MTRRLTDLNRVIDEKADRAEILLEINKKATSTDVAIRIGEIVSLIEDSSEDLKREIDQKVSKTDFLPKLQEDKEDIKVNGNQQCCLIVQ